MAEKKVVRYKLVKHKWPDEIKAERDRRIKRICIVAFCVFCFVSGFLINSMTSAKRRDEDETFAKLSSIYEVMKDRFYFGEGKKDFEETLINGAIRGMVDAGEDSHTSYMMPTQAEKFTSSMEGSYVGIGVQYYGIDDSTFMIDKVFKNSPAEEAGLLPGDLIYAVNGKVCENMDADKVKEMMKGKAGTKVKVEIVRGDQHMVKTVERRDVANTVTSEIKGDVGFIQLNTFADTSGEEFGNHLEDLSKTCKQLVIDLRNNGGGYLVAAQEIASYLVPEGKTVFEELSREKKITTYKSMADVKKYKFDHIVVLVNGDTASAAEVLTMALKDNLDVTIVGEKTYGKGTIQVPITFKDGSYLKYTAAKWLTPKAKSIDLKGITPDIIVSLDPAITTPAPKLDDDEICKADTVNIAAKSVQTYLKFLGYPVDRTDEYFSNASSAALKRYQADNGLSATGEIDAKTIISLLTRTSAKWHSDSSYDTQLVKALEVANGN